MVPQRSGSSVAAHGKQRQKKRNGRPRRRRSGGRNPARVAAAPEVAASKSAKSVPASSASLTPAPLAEPPPSLTRPTPEIASDDALLEALRAIEDPFLDDDFVGEAVVTIVERHTPFDLPPPLETDIQPTEPPGGPLRAAYRGPIEEAVVEIYEVPPSLPESEPPRPKKKGRRASQRASQALSDGSRV